MYEPAIVEARKALKLDDRSYLPPYVIALSYFFQGKMAEAQEAAEEAFRIAPWEGGVVRFLAGILVRSR